MRATNVLIATNVLLIAAKTVVALLTGSIAVLATLVDSLFDMLGALLAWLGVREAAKPADAEHLYGHKKIENLSSLAQCVLIALTALAIIYEAVRRFSARTAIKVNPLDLTLVVFTIIIDVVLAFYLRRKSRELRSAAIEASAGNYYSDVLQNSAVLVGLALANAGQTWGDPAAAMLLSVLMLRAAYKIGLRSANELIDISPPGAKIAEIQEAILRSPGVRGFHKLRARQLEDKVFLDADVQMEDRLPLSKAHALTHEIKRRLKKIGVEEAVIHLEPLETHDDRQKLKRKNSG